MAKSYIILGSNIGDTLANLKRASELLEQRVGELVKLSSIYQTEPWGNKNQQPFLNQALEINTTLSPVDLMQHILQIETDMGRVRSEKWEPRIIDIDILFYQQRIINQESLIVPHPFLHERRFVLAPLNELAPDFIHPVLQKTVTALLTECADGSLVEKM